MSKNSHFWPRQYTQPSKTVEETAHPEKITLLPQIAITSRLKDLNLDFAEVERLSFRPGAPLVYKVSYLELEACRPLDIATPS
jgi:hypothetical protein